MVTRPKLVALAAVLAAALIAPAALAGETPWTDDAKAALATAVKDGKDLLINYTGSDWCGWCTRLDKEVFSQEAFVAEAPKHFVFLKLDFPRRKPQSEALKKQNAEWRDKHGIRGFPTILLADATGKPYAKTGYRRGGADAYLKHLDELRAVREQRDAAMAKAAAAQGVEKAKLLDEALGVLDSALVMIAYSDVVDQIVALDADGTAGLKKKYAAMALVAKVEAAMRTNKIDEANALIDQGLKDCGGTGQPAQNLLFSRSLILYRQKNKPAAKAALEAAIKAAPDTPKAKQIQAIIARVFKDTK